MREIDERIIKALQKEGRALSPSALAVMLRNNQIYVWQRLDYLVDMGKITKVGRGLYELKR